MNYCVTVNNGNLYKALLDQICNKLEGKENCLADMETITDSIKIALAGKCSKQNGGLPIRIDSPELDSVSFDGYAFEKEYAAKAVAIYI